MSVDIATPRYELQRHAESYHRFMLGVKWCAIHLASLLVLLTLWFCTGTGFLGAFVSAALVFGVMVYAMRHGLAHSTERDGPGHGGMG